MYMVAYNPKALESMRQGQMSGDEPIHRMLRAQQAEKDAERRAAEASRNVIHAEGRFGKPAAVAPEQTVQADAAAAEAIRDELQKPELVITEADFFAGSDIEWLNAIPARKIGRINEILDTLGVPDLVAFNLSEYASVEGARKDLIFTWNQLLHIIETDVQAFRSTSPIMSRRNALATKVRALVQDVHRREVELAQAPQPENKPQSTFGAWADKLRKVVNW